MSSTPEGKVKAAIKKLLKSYGSDVWYCMPMGTGYGRAGVPDFIICARGNFIAVEAKADASKAPTALQNLELRAIKKANGYPLVIHKDNLHVLEDLLEFWIGIRE